MLPMQSPLSSIYTSGILGQYQYSHLLLHVKKDVESSQSAPGITGALPSPLVPVEHSTPTPNAIASFLDIKDI